MKYYRQQEAARALGITPRTLRRWLKDARMEPERSYEDNRAYLLTSAQVASLADSHSQVVRPSEAPPPTTDQVNELLRRVALLEQALELVDPEVQSYIKLVNAQDELWQKVGNLEDRLRYQRTVIDSLRAEIKELRASIGREQDVS